MPDFSSINEVYSIKNRSGTTTVPFRLVLAVKGFSDYIWYNKNAEMNYPQCFNPSNSKQAIERIKTC